MSTLDDMTDEQLEILKDKLFMEYLQVKGKLEVAKPISSLAMFPVTNDIARMFLMKHENVHWSEQEYDLQDDVASYDSLTPPQRQLIDNIGGYFMVADGGVSENLKLRFLNKTDSFESKAVFTSQDHIELVHAMGYGTFMSMVKRGTDEMIAFTNDLMNKPYVMNKINFLRNATFNPNIPMWELYLTAACTEGLHFCSSFNFIFWFRSIKKLMNFVAMNELISRDESIHRDFMCYNYIMEVKQYLDSIEDPEFRLSEKERIRKRTYEIVKLAVDLEIDFIRNILPEPIDNINADRVITFLKCIADNLLNELKLEPIYKVKNDCEWVDEIAFHQKVNFYDSTVSAYNRGKVSRFNDWKKFLGWDKPRVNPCTSTDVDF